MLADRADAAAYADIIAGRVERDGPYAAEIVAGCDPRWHVVVAQPGRQITAAAGLIGRRFGIYLPYYGKQFMLGSYVLVFVWSLESHWRRIRACTGVTHVLLHGDRRPAIVPDWVVDHIQAAEALADPKVQKELQPMRRRASRGRPVEPVAHAITISPRQLLVGLANPDAAVREAVFHRAIGLAGGGAG